MQNNFDELYEAVDLCPYNRTIFNHFKENKYENNIDKALRFLYLSNYSLYGKSDTLYFNSYNNSKSVLLNDVKNILQFLKLVKFEHKSVFDVRLPLSYPKNRPLQKYGQFIYCDPPYIQTTDNYSNSFTENDTRRLVQKLIDSELRFAISEFKSDITEQIAKDFKLNYIEIIDRKSLLNRNTEILITNYEIKKQENKPNKFFNF